MTKPRQHIPPSAANDSYSSSAPLRKPRTPPAAPVPSGQDNTRVPAFMAWPTYLFEKMATPWSNYTSAVSWVDNWQIGKRITVPKSKSHETATQYFYLVELPGVRSEQIILNYHKNTIMLRIEEATDTKRKSRQNELNQSIRRAFPLPVYANAENITAELNNAILTITIPKTDRPGVSSSRLITVTETTK